MQKEAIAVKHNVVAIGPFYDTDVAASQTDAQLLLGGSAAGDEVVMPCAGRIVGISAHLSAAASAGTLTVGATVGGTEDADTTVTITTAVTGYKQVARDLAKFAAGASIGVEITTSASWDGTTADLDVFVFVLLEDMTF